MYKAFCLIVALVSAFSILGFSSPQEPSPTSAQQSAVAPEESVKLRADLILVDVLPVQKKTGRIIGNLKPEDFTVFEDGVKQSVPYFSKEKLPVSIVVLVDRAGCVNPFSEQIRAATIKAIGHLKPEDEVAIMTFSNKVSLVQPFTRDRSLIANKITNVEQQHRSEQHYFNAAIYEASEYIRRAANPAGRRAIIVLTSLEASIDFSKTSEKEALDSVLESGAVISGILVQTVGGRIDQGIRGKPTSWLRHLGLRAGSLKMFVEETGGELVGAPPPQIDPTMNRLVDNISQSYSLAYTPTNPARDGKRRRIRVEISPEIDKQEGKTVVLARKSYVMAKEPVAKK